MNPVSDLEKLLAEKELQRLQNKRPIRGNYYIGVENYNAESTTH